MSTEALIEDLYQGLDDLLFAGMDGPEGHAEALLAAVGLDLEDLMDSDPLDALGLADLVPPPPEPPDDDGTTELTSSSTDAWADEAESDFGDKVLGLLWKITHVDDMVAALVRGAMSGLIGQHRVVNKLREAYDSGETEGWTVTCLPPDRSYVVFSDHHFLSNTSKHDYFSSWNNRAMYELLLWWYGTMAYTLVDAGDVEDLIVKEPTWSDLFGDQFFDLVAVLSGDWVKRNRTLKQRKKRYKKIRNNYVETYAKIGAWFHSQDRFVKLVGNHDTDLRDPKIEPLFQDTYGSPSASMTDLLLISHLNWAGLPTGEFRAFVAHGHQFDPWTNEHAGPGSGEKFTEAMGWFGAGADRKWDKPAWLTMNQEGWENFLVKAPSKAPGPMNKLKVRHMSERTLHRAWVKHFEGVTKPWLVLGHTHEPRDAPWTMKDSGGQTWGRYLNTGAAGRYQDLIWCVEILDGDAKLIAWTHNPWGFPTRHTMATIPGQPRMRMAPAPW